MPYILAAASLRSIASGPPRASAHGPSSSHFDAHLKEARAPRSKDGRSSDDRQAASEIHEDKQDDSEPALPVESAAEANPIAELLAQGQPAVQVVNGQATGADVSVDATAAGGIRLDSSPKPDSKADAGNALRDSGAVPAQSAPPSAAQTIIDEAALEPTVSSAPAATAPGTANASIEPPQPLLTQDVAGDPSDPDTGNVDASRTSPDRAADANGSRRTTQSDDVIESTRSEISTKKPPASQAVESVGARPAGDDGKPNRQVAEADKPSPATPSVFDQKVARANDAASDDHNRQSNHRDGGQASAQSTRQASVRTADTDSREVDPRVKFNLKGDDVEQAKAVVGIRSGEGDGPAAALGRLLVQPDNGAGTRSDHSAGTAVAGHGSPGANASPSPIVSGNSGTPPASPADTLAHVFDSALPRSDGVEAAAKWLKASSADGRYQATLQLDPPDMGSIRIQVRMANDAMTLRVDADTAAISRLIESRLNELRQALDVHGIRVEHTEIVVRSESSNLAGWNRGDNGGQSSGGDGRHSAHASFAETGADSGGNAAHWSHRESEYGGNGWMEHSAGLDAPDADGNRWALDPLAVEAGAFVGAAGAVDILA